MNTLHKDYFWYEARLLLFRFIIFGFTGYVLETVFSGIISIIGDMQEQGTVFINLANSGESWVTIWTFFMYCPAALLFTWLVEPVRKIAPNIIVRALIWTFFLYLIEYSLGKLIFIITGTLPWDYSSYFCNIGGLITLVYFPVWFAAGIFGEWLHDRLMSIDDIIVNAGIGFEKQTKIEHFVENKRR